jgi:superfamily II DNA or RNA helicase
MSSSIGSYITLRVQDSSTFVVGKMTKELYQEFKKTLGYKDPNAIWRGKNAKNWDGYVTTVCFNKTYCKCSLKKDGVHFPTGLYSRALEFFRAYGVDVTTVDERTEAKTNNIVLTPSPSFQVRDYQQEVIDKAVNQQRGIIKVATGGGKTAIGAGIIQKLSAAPFIFYVTSNDLLRQAKDELEKFLLQNGSPLKVGSIGGGKFDIKDVNVLTVQTAIRAVGEKYHKFDEEDEVEDISEELQQKREAIASLIHNAKGIICDEVQHWAAETCQILADHSVNARFRFGLSATPWRDMGDDLLIDSCFGKLIHEINASFLIRKGILVKPTIYFVHTRKSMDEDINYATAYKEGIVQNEERNLLIGNIAQNMVKEGRHVLILVRHIEHGELLESMIPDSFFVHGSKGHKVRQTHIDDMRLKKVPVTIATSIFDEGVDVKPLDGLILAGSGKSQTRALQRIGRVIRTFEDPTSGFVKKDAYIVDFHDNMKYMLAHSRARRRIYETEPEFVIKDFKGTT